jgi:membrane-associated protease RseP (regulator of RpoE activity)
MRMSMAWAGTATLSLVLLAWLARGGLYLVGFLALVIMVHEAGHLLMARRAGMGPVEFFWGFGPEVISFERNGCRYGIKAVFLGGYVKLLGMTPSSELPPGFPEARTYRAASHRSRLATILAGPFVNLGTAAAAFALAAAVDGASAGQALRRGGGDLWFVVRGTARALGIWAANLGDYAASVFDWSGGTEAPVRFMSPVAQARVTSWAVGEGLAASLRWFAILSAAVGVVNLLPLPPLDGSHAVVAATEGVVARLRPGRLVRFDVARLLPLAYFTVGALVLLSVSALVLDVRDLLG